MSAAENNSNEQEPNWRLKSWYPDLDEKKLQKFSQYFSELQKFNKVINLVSQKTILNADAIHFADSINAARLVYKNINKNDILHDIGSGNGFPGLVFAILYPGQKMLLIDSDERKCEFIKHVAGVCGLLNVTVQTKKIESFSDGSINQAICRGFAPLPKALLMLRKIVPKGGAIYHLKSEEWAIEVSQIPTQLCSLWQPSLVGEYSVPVGGAKLFVVKTAKIA